MTLSESMRAGDPASASMRAGNAANAARPARPSDAKLAGTALVEASAGTGKTFTITTLFLRLVVEQGLSVREIVVVTFTEAATAELRSRIRRRLREALVAFEDASRATDPELRAIVERASDRAEAVRRISAAISELDLSAISTIHAFCLRALQERAFESGARFGLELLPDTSELAREIADDYWSSRMVPMAPDLYRMVSGDFSRKVTRTLVDAFARRPAEVPILPEVPADDPEKLRPALADAYAAARATWRAHGGQIRQLLIDSNALSKNAKDGYVEVNVERWCDELDAVFASEAPWFSCADGLDALSACTLADRTVRKRPPPSHSFFAQAEGLFELSTRAKACLLMRLKRELADYVRREMALRKAARGVQGFEDLRARAPPLRLRRYPVPSGQSAGRGRSHHASGRRQGARDPLCATRARTEAAQQGMAARGAAGPHRRRDRTPPRVGRAHRGRSGACGRCRDPHALERAGAAGPGGAPQTWHPDGARERSECLRLDRGGRARAGPSGSPRAHARDGASLRARDVDRRSLRRAHRGARGRRAGLAGVVGAVPRDPGHLGDARLHARVPAAPRRSRDGAAPSQVRGR
jgi:UvrD/REP helicase N-terminal domain